tara:strand:- start:393 stop:620 length:228 start_codon:yes stop_codon:yes gene_type:complete
MRHVSIYGRYKPTPGLRAELNARIAKLIADGRVVGMGPNAAPPPRRAAKKEKKKKTVRFAAHPPPKTRMKLRSSR